MSTMNSRSAVPRTRNKAAFEARLARGILGELRSWTRLHSRRLLTWSPCLRPMTAILRGSAAQYAKWSLRWRRRILLVGECQPFARHRRLRTSLRDDVRRVGVYGRDPGAARRAVFVVWLRKRVARH